MNKVTSQSGFSLIELMVAVGIMGLTSVLILGTFTDTFRLSKQVSKIVEQGTDTLVGENVIFNDLRNIDPSYNVIDVKDDSGQGFFDYIPDVPEKYLGSNSGRQITLGPKGKSELLFVEADLSAGSMMIYDPVAAYEVGAPPASLDASATLTFSSLNRNDYISNLRKNFWQDGQLLMLDTPARVRPVVGGVVNLLTPPRSPVYIGQVSGQMLSPIGAVASQISRNHPESGALIENADQFLRTIPPVGGGQTFVRLRAVRIMKYFVKDLGPPRGWALYRSYLQGSEFSEPFLVTDKIESVVFIRRSVNQKLIEYLIKKEEQKVGNI